MSSEALSYFQFGDERPSSEQLETMLWAQPDKQGRFGWKRVLAHDFLKSELCIDFASVEPEWAAVWVRRSEEYIQDLLSAQSYYRKKGPKAYRKFTAPILAAARLRAVELSCWESAIVGTPLQYDYEAALQAGHDAMMYGDAVPSHSKEPDCQVDSKIREFVPILLGARREHQSPEKGKGWMGRLGLIREERRQTIFPDCNPNWDASILFGNDPELFIDPVVRLSIKPVFPRKQKGRSSQPRIMSAYRKARVVPLSSREAGFNNPGQIILSCMDEIEPLASSSREDVTLLSSRQLDNITDRIQGTIHREFDAFGDAE